MLVECSATIGSLGELKLDISGGLAHHDLEIVILQALRDFIEDKQAFVSHLTIIILEEVNNVLGHAHI